MMRLALDPSASLVVSWKPGRGPYSNRYTPKVKPHSLLTTRKLLKDDLLSSVVFEHPVFPSIYIYIYAVSRIFSFALENSI